MKTDRKTQRQHRLQHAIFIALLLACLGFAGWLSNAYNIRSDWTSGSRHSLSTDTRQLLDTLDSAVTLRSYQPDDPLLQAAVKEILQRYKLHKSDFDFQIINPDIHVNQAKSDGITSYGQTVIEYRDQQEKIATLNEEALTNALLRLQRGKHQRIVFLTQHGERSITDTSPSGYALLAQQLRQKGFDPQPLSLLQQSIHADDLLIISSLEKPLLQTEQAQLLTHIEQGGKLLWLQDPTTDNKLSFLSDLLSIEFIPGTLVDDNEKVQRMLKLGHPAIIPVLEYRMHPITQKMQYFTLFTTSSAIRRLQQDSDWIHSDLLISSDSSWVETSDLLPAVRFDSGEDTAGPHSLGMALQRQITINEQSTSQRVVVIGDSDFLANNHLGQGGNLEFIIKAISWLSEDDALIQIAPKNAPDTQLTLSPSMATGISLLFLIGLPVGLFICGLLVWIRRRRT